MPGSNQAEGVGEAIERIDEADERRQLDDRGVIEMILQLAEEGRIHLAGARGYALTVA